MTTICFFSGDITRDGGTERVASTVANGLARDSGYRVIFLSLVEQKSEPFYAISPEIKRYALKHDGKWVHPGAGYLRFIPLLRKFLKEESIDAIVDVDIVLDALSLPAAACLRTKVVSWEHFHYAFEQGIPYRRAIVRLSAQFSDYIVTLTEHDKRDYQRFLRRKKGIAAISNPLHIVPTRTGAKEKMLITTGHLEYEKGIDMLAKIIPEILTRHPDWKWYILGDGTYRDRLEEIQERHALADRLVLTGAVRNVEAYLERASVMVMTSRSEGFSMSILEARSCMVPCIAFDVPVGPSELIANGTNGFLVPPFDLEEMARKISQLVEDHALRERFSYASLEGLEKYKAEETVKEWKRLLGRVTNGTRQPSLKTDKDSKGAL